MRIRRSFVWALPLAIAVLFTATASKAQGTQEIDTSWPREIESDLGKIIIYQPQLDSLGRQHPHRAVGRFAART